MQIEELKPFFFPDCTENCLISLLYFLSLYHDNRKKWHIWIFLSSWIFDNTKVSDCQQKLLAFGRSSVSIQPFLVYKVHPFLQEWTRENFVSPYPRGRRTGSEEASQLDSAAKHEKATNNPSRSTVAFIDCAAETFPAPSFTKLSGASLVAQQQRICLSVQETQVSPLSRDGPLEKEVWTNASILAWEISRTEEPGRLPSVSPRLRHNLATQQQQHDIHPGQRLGCDSGGGKWAESWYVSEGASERILWLTWGWK